MTKETIIDMLVNYASNMIEYTAIAEYINKDEEAVREVLGAFQQEWDEAECNEEGATITQARKMDSILFQTYRELITL